MVIKLLRSIIVVAMVVLLVATISVEAAISVGNVVCQQRYPWNGKVDIDYEVTGGVNDTNIWITATGFDKTSNETIELRSLTGDGADTPVKPGKHHMIWDSAVDTPKLKSSAFTITLTAFNGKPLYMVIDLSGGTNATRYSVSYLPKEPAGGWTTEYKTNKMVLRLIPPGSFTMGSPEGELGRNSDEAQHEVTITKSFYIGVFEVTQKQFELIKGYNPSCYLGETRPVEYVSYDVLRGTSKGANWPADNEVDDDSFFGLLRTKTQKSFDLPTEAQWEYACRAKTTTAWNNGTNITNVYTDGNLDKLGRYFHNVDDNKGGYEEHTTVGSYLCNNWGLYDMHGNVDELCLDWYDTYDDTIIIDPVGPESGDDHPIRGGSWNVRYYDSARGCRSANRLDIGSGSTFDDTGFRVVLGL